MAGTSGNGVLGVPHGIPSQTWHDIVSRAVIIENTYVTFRIQVGEEKRSAMNTYVTEVSSTPFIVYFIYISIKSKFLWSVQ